MRIISSLLLLFTVISIISCGSNIAEKGKQAYQSGDYNQAIQLLTTAKSDESIQNDIDELIVLAYMYRGNELYRKTQNLKSFTGNYQSALKHFPKVPSEMFISEYSKLLIELARAYKDTKPNTVAEGEANYKKSIALLEETLKMDSTRTEAKKLFGEIEALIFQKYLDKAGSLFTTAKKTKDWDLLFAAELYLEDAEKLNAKHPDLKLLRQKIRKETLGVLNYRDGVSLAVTEKMFEKGKMILFLAVKNYKNKAVQFDPQAVKLIDLKGTSYQIDKEEMRVRELFGQKPIKSKTLDKNDPYTEGVIAFDTPEDLTLSHLALQVDGEEITRKYFR